MSYGIDIETENCVTHRWQNNDTMEHGSRGLEKLLLK